MAFCAVLALAACGGSSPGTGQPPANSSYPTEPDGGIGTGGGSIVWGPRLDTSGLSPVFGAGDEFAPDVMAALIRAARAVPNGASQSSWVDADGRTADEFSVRVVYDEDVGNLVHEITDHARIFVRVPFVAPRRGLALAAFTDLIPGIEPDLSSYPHEVLGVWAWEGEDGALEEAGAFWALSQPVPPVAFGSRSPAGTATYEGDAVGLYAADDAAAKFLADVELVADFDHRTVGGVVESFRSFAGQPIGDLSVTLDAAEFPARDEPFSGDTAAADVAGSGKWGARWSDGLGWTMGGTFGFAADDGSVAVLGAFTACACASAAGGNPDDPVATKP